MQTRAVIVWEPKDNERLRQLYPRAAWAEIHAAFPSLERHQIIHRASRLGIRRDWEVRRVTARASRERRGLKTHEPVAFQPGEWWGTQRLGPYRVVQVEAGRVLFETERGERFWRGRRSMTRVWRRIEPEQESA